MSIFGRILTDDQVEDAVVNHLFNWTSTFLTEIERQLGLTPPYYQRPAKSSYTVRADFDKWPEEMLPLVVVVAPGIDDDPIKEGKGQYRAKFNIGVTSVVSSISQVETRRYAYRMGGAIRAAMVKKQSLDHALNDSVRGVDWIGERNSEIEQSADRSVWANRQLFVIEVSDVLTRTGSPAVPEIDPTAAPPPDPPSVLTATETIVRMP